MAVIHTRDKVLSVGSVDMRRWVVSAAAESSIQESWVSADQLPDDMFFKVMLLPRMICGVNSSLGDATFKFGVHTEDVFQVIRSRMADDPSVNRPPDSVGFYRASDTQWIVRPDYWQGIEGFIFPPGLSPYVAYNVSGTPNANDVIDFRCIMVQSANPHDLWPYVGAQVGGIAGQVNERAGA